MVMGMGAVEIMAKVPWEPIIIIMGAFLGLSYYMNKPKQYGFEGLDPYAGGNASKFFPPESGDISGTFTMIAPTNQGPQKPIWVWNPYFEGTRGR